MDFFCRCARVIVGPSDDGNGDEEIMAEFEFDSCVVWLWECWSVLLSMISKGCTPSTCMGSDCCRSGRFL